MAIIFNIYAIFQAIVSVALLALLHLILRLFQFDYDLLGGTREASFSLQFMALVCAWMDAKGVKGHVFFIPTWIILILGSLFVLGDSFSPGITNMYRYTIYGGAIFITLFYFRKSSQHFTTRWAICTAAREELQKQMQQSGLSDKEYWQLASHLYYKPSFLFLHAYPVWAFLFSRAIDGNDFLEHYKYLINSIPVQTLVKTNHREWISELQGALNSAADISDFSAPHSGFSRLAMVIDQMNKELKS